MFGSRFAYTVCMIAATIVAGVLLRRRQSRLQMEPYHRWGIAIGGLIGATFAAKLPFILGADPSVGLIGAWLSDGKTILWGLAGGYIGVEIAKWTLLLKTSTGDSFVVAVAVAIAIGRVGCLLFGCCYGVETDQSWGFRFIQAPDGGTLLRHPTQIYEIVFHLGFAVIAWSATRQVSESTAEQDRMTTSNLLQGNWMPLYLLAYSVYRFSSEFIRPETRGTGGLTFYQWSAIVIGCGFAMLLISRWRRTNRLAIN